MPPKKPKKDEIVPYEGVLKDLTKSLIQVDNKNIAIVGNVMWEKCQRLELGIGEHIRIVYQNGILKDIDRIQPVAPGTEPIMHIDKEHSQVPSLQSAVKDIRSPSESQVISSSSGATPPEKSGVHMQLSESNLAELLNGKTYEEIYNLKEIFDKIAHEANVKDTIDEFDKLRKEGAVVAEAELTGIGSVWHHEGRFDGTIYEHGTEHRYEIAIIEPETEEDQKVVQEVMVWAREDFNELKKIFPTLDQTTFLAVFLKGYERGLNKGGVMFKELDKAFKKE